MKEKKITSLVIADYGGVFEIDGEIEEFTQNGEMAPVKWYRQGNKQFNGKFVIAITYED